MFSDYPTIPWDPTCVGTVTVTVTVRRTLHNVQSAMHNVHGTCHQATFAGWPQ